MQAEPEVTMRRAGASTAITAAEADEVRALLDDLPHQRRAVQRMSTARLRRMGLGIVSRRKAAPTLTGFEQLVSSGELSISDGSAAAARIQAHPSRNVFRVAVGVTGRPVPPTWSAFEQRYQWFGRKPKSVTSGAHLFVLAVDRWKSAVVGLYEAVSAGADKLPNSPDPERWPWAFGVRPLAAVPPPEAERVDGQTGPQSGLPIHVDDEEAVERLYRAVAGSPSPPGPRTLEQRVQELEWLDVIPDVLDAVRSLGKGAREPEVISRAIEIGGWSGEELEARAWYTGSGVDSHIEHIVKQVLLRETGSKGLFDRMHGVYSLTGATANGLGVEYRPASKEQPAEVELPACISDLAELDRATRRHMDLQDRLAEALRQRDIDPRSPGSWQPQYDLAFEHRDRRFVVEVKSGDPVSTQQVRLGVGQLLEYRYLLRDGGAEAVEAVLMIESVPPAPWHELAQTVGIRVLRADELDDSLSALLSGAT